MSVLAKKALVRRGNEEGPRVLYWETNLSVKETIVLFSLPNEIERLEIVQSAEVLVLKTREKAFMDESTKEDKDFSDEKVSRKPFGWVTVEEIRIRPNPRDNDELRVVFSLRDITFSCAT